LKWSRGLPNKLLDVSAIHPSFVIIAWVVVPDHQQAENVPSFFKIERWSPYIKEMLWMTGCRLLRQQQRTVAVHFWMPEQ
jgi:hypothetical protein